MKNYVIKTVAVLQKCLGGLKKNNHGEKSLKAPFVIYLDIECILKKEKSCQNNPKNSYIEKPSINKPSGWVMFTKCSFDETKNKLNHYRGRDCIKKLCGKLKIVHWKELTSKRKK